MENVQPGMKGERQMAITKQSACKIETNVIIIKEQPSWHTGKINERLIERKKKNNGETRSIQFLNRKRDDRSDFLIEDDNGKEVEMG